MANMGMDYEAAQGLMGALADDLALIADVEANLNDILIGLSPDVFDGKAAEVVRQRLQQIIKALQNNRQAWEELVKRGNDTISEFESQDQQLKSANPIQA